MGPLHVTEHSDAAALLSHAAFLLERREHGEIENGVMLGVCAAASRAAPASDALWLTIDDDLGPVAAAMRTPPYHLLVSRMAHDARRALIDALRARGSAIPGVTSIAETAHAFGAEWAAENDVRASVTMRQGVYALTRVTPLARAPRGRMRPAEEREAIILEQWASAFAIDAALPSAERDMFPRLVRSHVRARTLSIWELDGAPVSMACVQGATKNGIRVSMVYTPPEHRGHGFASACVAAVSERELASGRRFCMLYADLANPTSNGIYRRIGYQMIGESVMVAFSPRSVAV